MKLDGRSGMQLHQGGGRDSLDFTNHRTASLNDRAISQGLGAMDYQLLVVKGRSGSEALKLEDGVTSVGRHDDCQIRIKSSQVSRRHCEFFEKKGLLVVKDLGSANGTIVNGKKINGQQVLEPGDELMIGSVTLRVAKIGEAPPIKAPAGDTAVVEAIPVGTGGDDDFVIDFDDEPSDVAGPEDLEIEATPGTPAAAAAPEPSPAAAPPPKKAAAPEPVVAEPALADEAIADFLLDIKLDEDE